MKEWEKAWLACALDTDGGIGIHISYSYSKKLGKRYKYYIPKVEVCNTFKDFVLRACELANFVSPRKEVFKDGRRTIWRARVKLKDARCARLRYNPEP